MSKGTVNKVILIGRLGADPDVRYLSSGDAVVNISIATDSQWKDRNTGQLQEHTEWHRVALFGKTAEIAGQYLRKGSKVYIEGRIRTRKWQDQSGQDRYTTEIIGDQMQMMDSKASSSGSSAEYESNSRPNVPPPPRPAPRPSAAPVANYEQAPPDFDAPATYSSTTPEPTDDYTPPVTNTPVRKTRSVAPNTDQEFNDHIPF